MEFNIKLQQLRKQKGLTQEDLADALFVSRTAISKWESGRGYPSIDSLKAIAKYFGVSIDSLLSSDELLTIAEEDTKQANNRFRDLVFGLLDISIVLFLFLPFFGEKADTTVQSVSLFTLDGITPYLKATYFIFVTITVLWGIAVLALQYRQFPKNKISLVLNAIGILLFIISMQPYPSAFLFIYIVIKALMFTRKQ